MQMLEFGFRSQVFACSRQRGPNSPRDFPVKRNQIKSEFIYITKHFLTFYVFLELFDDFEAEKIFL